MIKPISFAFLLLLSASSLLGQSASYKWSKEVLDNPSIAKRTLVAAHRGDWRNAPENSIQSLENAINLGAHIYELDIQLSKDSVLYLMHDKTIDRTTNKKGKVNEFTWDELKTFRLKNGLGRVTDHAIPSLEEFMIVSKGRIFLNFDKAYQHLDLVIELIQKLKMESEVYISIDGGQTLQDVEKRYGNIPNDIRLMPIINLNSSDYRTFVSSYLPRKTTMFQAVFKEENEDAFDYLQKIRAEGYLIWYNSLWASLCAGRDDDRAVEKNQKDETWGWMIDRGAHVIQSDRPIDLLNYLNEID